MKYFSEVVCILCENVWLKSLRSFSARNRSASAKSRAVSSGGMLLRRTLEVGPVEGGAKPVFQPYLDALI